MKIDHFFNSPSGCRVQAESSTTFSWEDDMLLEADIPTHLDGEARLVFVLENLRCEEPAYSQAWAAAEKVLQPFLKARDHAKHAEQAVLLDLPACVEALSSKRVRELTEPAITGSCCASGSELGQLLMPLPDRPAGAVRWLDHEYFIPPAWRLPDSSAPGGWLRSWLAALTPDDFRTRWRKDGERPETLVHAGTSGPPGSEKLFGNVMTAGRRATKVQVKRGRGVHALAGRADNMFSEKRVGGIVHVHRRDPASGMYLPWVRVGPSPVGGRGVFAARRFARGEKIGTYSGRLLGMADDDRSRAAVVASGSTMLLTLRGVTIDGARPPQSAAAQKRLVGKVLFPDSVEWPGAYVHMVNSAYDLQAGRMRADRQNCRVGTYGALAATKGIDVGQELLQNYGRSYHEGMG